MNTARNGSGEKARQEAGFEAGEEAGLEAGAETGGEAGPLRKGRRWAGPLRKGRRKGGKEERGSGTVLVLATGVLLLMLFGTVLLMMQSAVAANRAATAADLAALAAADTVRGMRAGDPCAVAGEVAVRNGAALTGCTINPGDHTVQVNTEVAAGLVPWPATGRARAGPPP